MDGSAARLSPNHFGRELLAGLLGLGIALGCLLPPLVHLVIGPLGPFIGGFVVTKQFRPGARGRAVIAATIGLGIAGIAGAAALLVRALSGSTPPSWFPSSSLLGVILGGIGLYGTLLGGAGSAVSAAIASKESPTNEDTPSPASP